MLYKEFVQKCWKSTRKLIGGSPPKIYKEREWIPEYIMTILLNFVCTLQNTLNSTLIYILLNFNIYA